MIVDNAFLVFAVMRFILSLCFLATGFASLVYGIRLYREGVGLTSDGTEIDAGVGKHKVRASLKTVGRSGPHHLSCLGPLGVSRVTESRNDRRNRRTRGGEAGSIAPEIVGP